MLETGVKVVNLYGPPGSGKSVAIEHLASAFGDRDVLFLDETLINDVVAPSHAHALVVFATTRPAPGRDVTLELAPWSDDDLIEYLLALHPHRCASVMSRIRAAGKREQLCGSPELWAIVLDEFATDDTLADIHAALRYRLTKELGEPEAYVRAVEWCLDSMQSSVPAPETAPHRLLRHRVVALLLASEKLAADIAGGRMDDLAKAMPRDLIRETAALLNCRDGALDVLVTKMEQEESIQPMAASLLLASDSRWRPRSKTLSNLRGALLNGAMWEKLDLGKCRLENAQLAGADLNSANLKRANLSRANLRQAILRDARLVRIVACSADFTLADISSADADEAALDSANLEGANLTAARLCGASFCGAKLSSAKFIRADLSGASIESAALEDADFSDAKFTRTSLSELRLCDAQFHGASFQNAKLLKCNLEYLEMPSADFRDADLSESDLTGSRMPHADFRDAILRYTGLADIDWERADLRKADLTGASFHMGSSRSGLVNSPIASEGSRTGFYTDDYEDLDYRPPEEIRKANLRGADLRGAKVEGADFYLVDLRDATYTPDQGRHFSRCGAILTSRQVR